MMEGLLNVCVETHSEAREISSAAVMRRVVEGMSRAASKVRALPLGKSTLIPMNEELSRKYTTGSLSSSCGYYLERILDYGKISLLDVSTQLYD